MSSFNNCVLNLHLRDKLPIADLKQTAQQFEARGMAPEAALLQAVTERLQLAQMEERAIIKQVRSAWEAQGGAPLVKPEEPAKPGASLENATAPEHINTGVDERELGQIVEEFGNARDGMVVDGHVMSHIFDAPAKNEIVRLADKAKVYHKEHGWMTVEQAKAKVEEWKNRALDQGDDPQSRSANSQKIVLSLFDLTGKWSQPWEEAGYQVFRFDIQDQNTYEDPETGEERKVGDVHNMSVEFFNDLFGSFDGLDVHAILAATPCTDFAVSGARHFAAKDADGRTVASVKLVHQTLRVIEYFKPAVWAIENPVGRIEKLGGLPPWRLSFDPNQLGDPYTKKTLLWGRFNADLPIAPVEPTEGSKMHKLYGGKSMATKNARSATPEGFSYGFFMANNAIDHPVLALANKFDRLDRNLIEQATAAGFSERQITEVVEDPYYMDLDDAAANTAIRELMDDGNPDNPPGKLPDLEGMFDELLAEEVAAKPAGDLGDMFDAILAEELSKRQASEPAPKARRARSKSGESGESGKSAKPATKATKAGPAPESFIRKYAKTPGELKNEDVRRTLFDAGDQAAEVASIIGEEGHLVAEVGKVMESLGYKYAGLDGLRPIFTKPGARSTGEAAVSAAKNAAVGFAAAVQGLGELFGANVDTKKGMVPDFDESKYQKAVPFFRAAIEHFGEAAADITEVMRAVIKAVLDKFSGEVTANMKPYVVRFVQDYQDGKFEGEQHADGTGDRAERNPENGADGQQGTEQSVFDVGSEAGGQARPAGGQVDAAGTGPVDGAGLPGRHAVDGGTASDKLIPVSRRQSRPAPGTAESGNTGGSGDRGHEKSQSQSEAIGEPATATGARLSLDEKRAQQRAAESVPVIAGDRENIDATLPFLLEGQRDDVHFAETRFANPDKQPGVVFTNGTGTGKTYTGLGIIKRFERMGKSNGIIVVPNNGIAQDWIRMGQDLGLKIKLLDSKTDHGDTGMVVTTYANFGDNPTLADREWDWVMPDEAHKLMAGKEGKNTEALRTLRALTRHPAGFHAYTRMKNRDLYGQLDVLKQAKGDMKGAVAKALHDKIRAADEALQPAYEAVANSSAKRPKAVFLSATPFAYVKAIDWAEGYLFSYPEDGKIGNSNQGGREKFLVQHFGYRIRYHKLTEPDGNVDQGLMARQFNSWLKAEGALSGRMLDVEADYSRRFHMVESALGTKIDEGLEFIREHDEYKHLYDPLMKQFDYLSRRFLLEAIKAKEVLPLVNKHLELGRKVVVIHDYKKGGSFNPFTMRGVNGIKNVWNNGKPVNIDLAELADKFKAERRDLVNLKFPSESALQILTAAFPDALIHNGDVPAKQLELNKKQFNADTDERRVMLLQSDKGAEGISLHDTTGKYQRAEVNIGMPSKSTALIQLEGRIYRTGQVTDAILDYANTGTMWERWTFAQTIAERADIVEALGMGDQARGLKDSIIEAFENSAPHDITAEDGRGGKARDRQNAKLLTDWDRAKSFYYGQLKRNSKTKSAEGTDYFATPEPLGLKMVEWADIRPGEDVLEPSAGHGAIARWFPIQSNKTINEKESGLIATARLHVDGNAKFVQGRFEDLHLVNKYDAIVMNPPFGLGGSDAIPHLSKAYQHLRDGGRIVALLPVGTAADKKLEKFLHGEDAPKDLYMVADIKLPTSTFGRAGTGVMTHIVILDKISDPAKAPQQVDRDYVSAEDNEELFERLQHSTMPGRVKTDLPVEIAIEEAKPAPRQAARAAAADATGAERYYAQFEFAHTKTGEQLFGAAMLNRTSMDTYKLANGIAKKHGGWYNKFVGGGALRGFLFKSSDDRAAFMAEAGQLDEVAAGHDAQNSAMPVFYSALARTIPDMAKVAGKDGSIKPEQARLWLQARQKEGKFKSDELQWSGVDDWLKAQSGRVAVADIARFVEENGVQVREVEKDQGKNQPGPSIERLVAQHPEEFALLQGHGFEPVPNADLDGQLVFWQKEDDNYIEARHLQTDYGVDRATEAAAKRLADAYAGMLPADKTKYSQYTLPGGENYRELLLTLPMKAPRFTAPAELDALPDGYEVSFDRAQPEGRQYAVIPPGQMHGQPYGGVRAASAEEARADALAVLNSERDNNARDAHKAAMANNGYRSNHWEEANIVAHVRFNDRTDADGKRVLFIEELQSDWGQQGLKEGFGRESMSDDRLRQLIEENDGDADTEGLTRAELLEMAANSEVKGGPIPAAPFVTDTKAWLSLGIKRMIRYAAENGYDRIAFVNGQQSADRYDLSKQISKVEVFRLYDGMYNVEAFGLNGRAMALPNTRAITAEQMADVIGKELTERAVKDLGNDGEAEVSYSGLDLKVGGEGMKTFYDKIVPQTVNDVLKKLGGGKASQGQMATPGDLFADSNRYVGPEYTIDQLKEALAIARKGGPNIMENPLTGGRLAWAFNRVANEGSLRKLIGLMESGQSFGEAVLHSDLASPGFAELMGGEYQPLPAAEKRTNASQQIGFDITPELRASALDGLPLFSKSFDGNRRRLLAAAAAAALAGNAKAGDLKLGKARPINPELLTQRVAPAVEKILRNGKESGVTSLDGGDVLRKALRAIALTGPKELRALAAYTEKLLPTSGTIMLTVDDTKRMNVHGVVELSPFVHLSLFTAEGRSGLTYETVLHEAMHVAVAARYRSLSVGMVRSNDSIIGMAAPQAAAAMKQFEAVWEEFRSATAGEKFSNKTLELAVSEARGNPDEFFVRTLSDPVLQAYMAGKRYEGKTLFERFKDWVKTSLFGFGPESGTAPSWLDAALAASGDVMQAMGGDRADFTRMAAISKAQAKRSNREYSRSRIQEDSPEFKAWFGDSKAVDPMGQPKVMYHGTNRLALNGYNKEGSREQIDAFRADTDGGSGAIYVTDSADYADQYTNRQNPQNGGQIYPVYVKAERPFEFYNESHLAQLRGVLAERHQFGAEGFRDGRADDYVSESEWRHLENGSFGVLERPLVRDAIQTAGFDSYYVREQDGGWRAEDDAPNDVMTLAVFTPEQIKSATGNNGNFDPNDPDIMASRALPAPLWSDPDMNRLDNVVHILQDKHIDTKRVVQAIRSEMGALEDKWDPYLQEELFHGRAATGFKDFLHDELRPLLQDLQARGVTMEQFEEYLHMRHAQEANEQIASINPDMQDGGSGIDTADAQQYLANLSPNQQQAFEALARRTDAITAGTQKKLVDYGLEKQSTINTWNATYQHYVPLMREDMENGQRGNGTGQGFSVRGPASQRRMGSERRVINIIANIAMARERAIVRGEKNRLDMALYGLALQAPNPDFWKPINPQKNPDALAAELDAMGLSQAEIANIIAEPRQRVISKQTGLVTRRLNPALRGAQHVVAVRINGEDRYIFFNERNKRAMRMALTLKNIGNDGLNRFLSLSAKVTRAFAAINTQYNPIFGIVNLIRDTGEGAINLSSTQLAGHQASVIAEQARLFALSAVHGFSLDRLNGNDLALWHEFQHEGGITGYRAMFSTSEDRAKELARELDPSAWMESKAGRFFTAGGTLKVPYSVAQKAMTPVFDWLSDYNEALENITRMAVYKVAKEQGLSRQQAASLAKNLTVNFNRKGAVGDQVGSLYAFFNAAVQGTARMATTLSSPAGKKVIAGGLLLGVLQALMMAAAGFDDDEPPEFVKAKNIVIPLGWMTGKKNYLTIPMPLGYAVIPTLSRLGTEFALGGGKKPAKHIVKVLDAIADTFNPVGNAGVSIQTIAPTAIDPFVALMENQDWTGKPIARKDLSSLHPTPGYTRAKETASAIAKTTAYYMNSWTGGTKYTPGLASPTPDQIDYLLGQFTGGVGREALKAQETVSSMVTGEELPAYKIPLAGRFYGNAEDKSSVSSKFYDNLLELNLQAAEVTGRAKDHANPREYLAEHPEARLGEAAQSVERDISALRKRKRELLEKGADKARIKELELQQRKLMDRFNKKVEQVRQKTPA